MPTLKINEIFYSIQGESTYAGLPTAFVRTSGCQLRCSYCDTTYAYHEGAHLTLQEIESQLRNFGSRYVCITGGEPLLQKAALPLIQSLCNQDYRVSVETGGAIFCEKVDLRAKLVIDIKTPDSGANDSFEMQNIALSHLDIEWKFVICSEKDFEWAENFSRQYLVSKKNNILYSPSFQRITPRWLAEKILQAKSSARLHLQLHKYIWPSNARGV